MYFIHWHVFNFFNYGICFCFAFNIAKHFVVSFAGEMFGKVKSDDSLVCELTSEMSCLT